MPKTTIIATATPLDGFLSLAREYCEENGLGSKFQRETRGYFLKSLARSYWNSIRHYMAGTEWPVPKASKAAGLDPSTQTRWDEMIQPSRPSACYSPAATLR